jgi:hypothetical protein
MGPPPGNYFFLGPLLAIGGLGAVLVLLPPFLDIGCLLSNRDQASVSAL